MNDGISPTPNPELQDQFNLADNDGQAKSLQPLLDADQWLAKAINLADMYAGDACMASDSGYGIANCPSRLTLHIHLAARYPALGNRTPARQEAERECETCRGEGTIDERSGGEFFSNPAATCPDCDGKGWWVATSRKQGTQATGEDAITLAFRLYGEDPDTFAPETRAVMDKLRPIVAERLGMAASAESESAAPLPVQGQDEWAKNAARYEWLRERGIAYCGDPERHLERGLVLRFTNLDSRIDAALRASSAPTTKQGD